MCDGPHAGFPRRATLAVPKGEWPYTEATPSGAAPTCPPEGVFRHKRLMELVELSGRTTGRRNETAFLTAIRHFSHRGPTTSFRRSIMPYNARA